MSNAELRMGVLEGRELKASADLPWERPELALPEPQDDFSALQLE